MASIFIRKCVYKLVANAQKQVQIIHHNINFSLTKTQLCQPMWNKEEIKITEKSHHFTILSRDHLSTNELGLSLWDDQ